ncbi:D-alanyl-D-alanine carboxypeptidase/D-alanyl-D-alanine-endopeptidase [Candidatus Dependentiae bacterium]|nr:D-alanyl-D-alanine carboxypeptidase/D-alanyl-D-alanine-endopeptidase [Candidatus Dependentiae bacterium]
MNYKISTKKRCLSAMFFWLSLTFLETKTIVQKLPSTITGSLNKLIDENRKKASIGIKVATLDTKRTLYQKNADTLFIPASNTKLFTAGAALHILGPSFRYETVLYTDRLYTTARMSSLYVKGSGDPTLLSQDLEKAAHTLRAKGIKEIRGNIVVDISIFDAQPTALGWAPGDGPIFDKSQVGGFIVDHSCITVRVKPAHAPGRKPLVTIEPSNDLITVENKAQTTTHAEKQAIHTFLTPDNKLIITGKIALKSTQKFYRIALHNPELFAAHTLRVYLKKQGIVHRGKIVAGRVPPKALILVRHYSKPAETIIKTMMKKSDNLYADTLFKTIGARVYGTPGTWEKGRKAVENFLTRTMKLPAHRYFLNDGSGLSRLNKVSPTALIEFLTAMYQKSAFKKQFIESFPISGTDGSLRLRMQHKTTKGKILAKTGSLTGVSSLSGYITLPGGKHLAFASMTNRSKGSAFSFKQTLEDKLCSLLTTDLF